MRLHDPNDAAPCRFAGAAQNGGNLDRMVRVIVKNIDIAHFADMRKAPLDAAKAGQRRADLFRFGAHFQPCGNRRQRILQIISARHGQMQL